MHYTRIYSDEAGESHFQEVSIQLHDEGDVGLLSEPINIKAFQFRENKPDYNWDYHQPPNRQFIILLNGEIEIETSLGELRSFKGGDILLVEDTLGKGHKTKNITPEIRKSIFIII